MTPEIRSLLQKDKISPIVFIGELYMFGDRGPQGLGGGGSMISANDTERVLEF